MGWLCLELRRDMDEEARWLVFSGDYWRLRQVMWEGCGLDHDVGWKE